MSLPIIAIIGRPNTGKSTLFNRLIGIRYAITSSMPGTTRDRIYKETKFAGSRIILVDTGGMDFSMENNKKIEADVHAQAKIAVREANVIFFVIDATEFLTSIDFDCASYLRKSSKPVILIANKADNKKSEQIIPQLFELGFGEPVPVSSIHNLGFDELEIAVKKILKKINLKKEKTMPEKAISIAIIGKPNVGKSSIVNAILGKERFIVSETPGTTIDAIDTQFESQNQNFLLIDTAGLRRRGKRKKGIEHWSVLRSLQAISRCDTACLVIDWETGISNQDLHVSQYILEAEKGLIIAVNKSDLMEDKEKEREKFLDLLHYRMSYIPWAPVIFTSALTKKNIFAIFKLAKGIYEERKKKIPQERFSVFLKATLSAHPPTRKGAAVSILKGAQTGVSPPAFTFYSNKPDLVHFSYKRFLENEIRRKFGFYGTPIRIEVKDISAIKISPQSLCAYH